MSKGKTSAAVAALSPLFVELEDINKLLDDFEKTRNKKPLGLAAVKIKAGAPKLKALAANPAYKNSDTAPLLNDLKNGFKAAFNRAKALKDGITGGGGGGRASSGAPAEDDQDEDAVEPPRKDAEQRVEDEDDSRKEEEEEEGSETARERARDQREQRERERAEKEKERERERKRREQQEENETAETIRANQRTEEEEEREQARLRELKEKEVRKKANKERLMQADEEDADQDDRKGDNSAALNDSLDRGETRATGTEQRLRGKDIWSCVLRDQEVKERAEVEGGSAAEGEYTVVFVGSKLSGKTTLIGRFLEKVGEPKPSTALEYSFGKRTKGTANDKETVNAWELAGGTSNSPLFEVCLSPECIAQTVVLIVVDLSEPASALDIVLKWLDILRSRAEQAIKALEKSNAFLAENLKNTVNSWFPEQHPDKSHVKPVGIPVMIVGTKYDLFQDFEAERRKIFCRTMRFIAHSAGAALVFLSTKDAKDDGGTYNKFRSLLHFYLFHNTYSRAPVTEYTKPVIIQAGGDTFEQIGRAPGQSSKSAAHNTGLAQWKTVFAQVFPPTETGEKADTNRFEEEAQKYPELSVDSMRSEKDRELERYQRAREREPISSPTAFSKSSTQNKKKYNPA